MNTLELRTNYLTPAGTSGLPPALPQSEAEKFQAECQQRNLEGFAGIIYLEGKELSVAGLIRLAGMSASVLTDPGILVGPYVTVDERTGRPTSYTGIMLYREVEAVSG